MMTVTGTTNYKAPEMFEGHRYTELVDEWSVGVVLYKLVEKHVPFNQEYLADRVEAIRRIDYDTGDAWGQLGRSAKDLLHQLLKPAAFRVTAAEALKSPWFSRLETGMKQEFKLAQRKASSKRADPQQVPLNFIGASNSNPSVNEEPDNMRKANTEDEGRRSNEQKHV